MVHIDLVFGLDDREPFDLVFGDDGSAGAQHLTLHTDGQITGLRGHLGLRTLAKAHAAGRISGLRGSIQVAHDINVPRPLLAWSKPAWQLGQPLRASSRPQWQYSDRLSVAVRPHWQPAERIGNAWRPHWQASIALAASARPQWQRGLQVLLGARLSLQQAIALHSGTRTAFELGMPLQLDLRARFEEVIRLRRSARVAFQTAVPLASGGRGWLRTASPLWLLSRPHFQDAMRPLPGRTRLPDPPLPEPCYVPEQPISLVFDQAEDYSLDLVFVCDRHGGGPDLPPAAIVIARRRTYIMLTSIEVTRVDTGQRLPVLQDGFGMRLERNSWTWGFDFNLHAAALALIQRGSDGMPRELEVKVNGQAFRMLAESYSRQTQFPKSVVRVSGRGKGALLDAPVADVRSFTQPAASTAQQLMLDVLTVNGVSNGWTLDWQITDWSIPAGTWAHQGTWMSAINDIASSVGAYVQPHDTDQVLRILPAYPVRSWLLAGAEPDIELPPGFASVEEVEWVTKPDYDSIYMHGEPGTNLFYRNRAGTPGTKPAPMAVHSLLVHADAAAQRAIADLSDTGRQVIQRLKHPVLPATGIIKPGLLLRYTDDGGVTRTGVTRGVSVTSGEARVDQTIEVQAHD
ncbi:hypothetical protein [Ottowia sp. VDI28]|uniref:hypothetical protein n=1 Tax=Ottowia sp. VDI28 TaxID=3133968 RepID=UPI003C2C9F52